ncbi:uncharacterized protein LOC129706769 isoform X2 [Leucoraja erinacea]|uniref:uncharacterized protein LOC129706769 isoform X2 n=1 Tax=Leucoraja erinaceus TaxID=7782 RepID=UPI0024550711|nr:uncharacterized protein LOC129706769 isoform X2 [Leucoraja erinacea]
MQWFTNQRTIYGKVTAFGTKTGSAGSTLTERNRWIEEKWRFLSGHIVRVVTRTSAPKEQHIIDHAFDDPQEGTSMPSPSTSQQHRSRHISSIDLTTPAEEGTDGNSIKSLINTVRDGIKLLEEGRLRPNSFTQRAVDFCQAIMEEEINERQWDFVWNMINGAITMRNKKLMEARAPEAQRPLVPQPRPPHFYDQRHSPSPLMFTEQQPARNPPLPFVYGEGRAQTPFQEGADGFADVNDSS